LPKAIPVLPKAIPRRPRPYHDPVQRIWSGDRDPAILTATHDIQDSALIHRLLDILT
jgi:hypothetical protein